MSRPHAAPPRHPPVPPRRNRLPDGSPAGAVRSGGAAPTAAAELRPRVTAMLHAAGERATTARLDVLGVLAAAGGHLGVAEIHRRVERERVGTNLSTVYRTVDRLTELGIAHVVLTGGEATYGLAIEEHHHVVCDRCGSTTSIAGGAIADLLTELGRRAATQVRTVEIHGLCADCSTTPTADPTPARQDQAHHDHPDSDHAHSDHAHSDHAHSDHAHPDHVHQDPAHPDHAHRPEVTAEVPESGR